MPKRDVFLGWVAPMFGMCSLTAQSIVSAVMDADTGPRIERADSVVSGPLIAAARTRLVRMFLESPADWLLQVDADMVFVPQQVGALLKAGHPTSRPILGALYVASGQLMGENTQWAEAGRWRKPQPRRLDVATTPNRPMAVDFVGAGMLLVHRRVFEAMDTPTAGPQPWFQETEDDGPRGR